MANFITTHHFTEPVTQNIHSQHRLQFIFCTTVNFNSSISSNEAIFVLCIQMTPLSCGNYLKYYCGDASNHTPISYNVSFETTSVYHHFVINKEAVVWNLFAGQWIVDFEGNERPGNHLNFYSTYYRGSNIHRFKHTANGCASLATPVPFPSPQLSNFEQGQYWDGWLNAWEHHVLLVFAKKKLLLSAYRHLGQYFWNQVTAGCLSKRDCTKDQAMVEVQGLLLCLS